MGSEGRRRIETALGWPHQAEVYRQVYDRLLGVPVAAEDEVLDLVAVETGRASLDRTGVGDRTDHDTGAPEPLVSR
jgi:hypothetical protein